MQACTAQVTIACPWREVCDFLSQPRNFAAWASWLGPTLRQERGEWTVRRPHGGRAKVRFCERNAFGVADHWVLDAEDHALFFALRVVPNGEGGEVLLTCFREVGCSEAAWVRQQQVMQRDLSLLKEALARAPQGRAGWARYVGLGADMSSPALARA